MEETFDIGKACAAQRKFQQDNKMPDFAPNDGNCYRCKKNIYKQIEQRYGDKVYHTGISVERAGRELVTGCPHCNRSYCD
jgi:PP-loop superfamily ATP-utilizing enzyme